jgi:hypothetical protein
MDCLANGQFIELSFFYKDQNSFVCLPPLPLKELSELQAPRER